MATTKVEFPEFPELVSPADAAVLLKVCRSTVYTLIHNGTLPAARIGGQFRIQVKDVQAVRLRRNARGRRARSTKKPRSVVHGGGFYRNTIAGFMLTTTGEPAVWICRRVEDFPHGVPRAGAVDTCTQCGAVVVFDPARTVAAPKCCMQCAGIEPLPLDRAN